MNKLKTTRRLSIAAFGLAFFNVSAQTPPMLNLQLYAGLSITGTVGTVYSIEYVTDLALPNNPSAWRCLEFLQLPASPYLWADKSRPATGQRFYRAGVFPAPTNMVFIPPGTFRMGSPTNEVDRYDWEGPQTAVTISHRGDRGQGQRLGDKFPDEWRIAYQLACYGCRLGDRKQAWLWLERAIDVAGKVDIRLKALDEPDLEDFEVCVVVFRLF